MVRGERGLQYAELGVKVNALRVKFRKFLAVQGVLIVPSKLCTHFKSVVQLWSL